MSEFAKYRNKIKKDFEIRDTWKYKCKCISKSELNVEINVNADVRWNKLA